MRRREFIMLVGGAAAWPLAAHPQQAAKRPTIGFLSPTAPSVASEWIAAFEQRLRELGWIDGRTVTIEYRWAEGKTERFGAIAAEFVRRNVDVIATWGTETAVAAKQATSVIPIVVTLMGDPVGSGLVKSLARPGANVTGLSTQHADGAGKRIGLLREVIPNFRQLAIMGNLGNSSALLEARQAEAAAREVGLEFMELDVRRSEDIAPAFALIKGRVDALYVASDAFMNTNRDSINRLALDARLPSVQGFRRIVATGGLMSYGPNYPDLFRRAADYVDKILHGTKPDEIPVEQPTKFELVINLKTAKALGIAVPLPLLGRADEVIE